MTTGRWLFSVAMLIVPSVVFAQDAPTSGTIRVDKPLMPPVIFAPEPAVGVTETSPGTLTTTGALTIRRWTLRSDTAWTRRDPHSQVSARVTVSAPGGFQFSAGVTGRQRYVMPLVVAQPLGSDGLVQEAGSSFFEPIGQSMVWDSQIRVEKVLKGKGALRIRAVGELYNPFDTGSLQTPRALKVGLLLGF